ncbi:MAG: hypothetical protein GXZ02_10815 [Clostridiales bacterium]|nr:hypothetical protein [Clostridiales bacterium]
MKKILGIICVLSILIVPLTVVASAITYLTSATTYSTYMNASNSFSSTYLTLEDPTLQYRYRNLKCDSTSATLNTKLYSYKVHWYNILNPSESLEGSAYASGLNASNSNVWYGKTYSIDCSSYQDILDAFDWMYTEDGYSARFYYQLSNTNGKNIHNNYGQWQIISSY